MEINYVWSTPLKAKATLYIRQDPLLHIIGWQYMYSMDDYTYMGTVTWAKI